MARKRNKHRKTFQSFLGLGRLFECSSCGEDLKRNEDTVCNSCESVEVISKKNTLPFSIKLIENNKKYKYIGDFQFSNTMAKNKIISLFYTGDINAPYVALFVIKRSIEGREVVSELRTIKIKNVHKIKFKVLNYEGKYYMSSYLLHVNAIPNTNFAVSNGYLNPKTNSPGKFVEVFLHKDKFYTKSENYGRF